jgi:hypothetical protein
MQPSILRIAQPLIEAARHGAAVTKRQVIAAWRNGLGNNAGLPPDK